VTDAAVALPACLGPESWTSPVTAQVLFPLSAKVLRSTVQSSIGLGARDRQYALPPIDDWRRGMHPCWAVARSTSFTMDWGAAPWVGLTCASGLTTAPARRNYVPICAALATFRRPRQQRTEFRRRKTPIFMPRDCAEAYARCSCLAFWGFFPPIPSSWRLDCQDVEACETGRPPCRECWVNGALAAANSEELNAAFDVESGQIERCSRSWEWRCASLRTRFASE
jgi:hypothetical protein